VNRHGREWGSLAVTIALVFAVGLAASIAARVTALATQREILVSSALKDLVIGSGIVFTERGEFDLKGVPESWNLFAVTA
jgi:class 3 adenylate cyclase